MNPRTTKLIMILALALACAASAYSAGDPPAIATGCCRDLTKRLNVPVADVTIVEAKEMVWPDASFGLPRPDEMYAQVVTPGWRIILEAKNLRYLYCTSDNHFRYGGPVGAWSASVLYELPPAQPDGNLNKDLYQISLAGTNPTLLIPNVERFFPQADGSIFASRRTSRSGFDLLYLAPGEANTAKIINQAFDFGEMLLSADSKHLYGFVNERMGNGWGLQISDFPASNAKPQIIDLPDLARPGKLFRENDHFYAHFYIGEGDGWYRLDPKNVAAGWEKLGQYNPPNPYSLMLNKSESLSANATKDGDKFVTAIVRRWFTGDEHPVAKIDNFECKGMALIARRFALAWGRQGTDWKAFTVDIVTGEVMPTEPEPMDFSLPFVAAPHNSPLK